MARVPTARRLRSFGTSIFAEMTALAAEHDAINLGQGFPDFEGPAHIKEAAIAALEAGHNQYARSMGVPPLIKQIARHQKHFYDLDLDPASEVTVTCGATEGIAASILGLVEPGDEVILFEPFYDSYPACVAMAGGVPRYCTLHFPERHLPEKHLPEKHLPEKHGSPAPGGAFTLDADELERCFSVKTRLLVLNTPHNPTGKVFTPEDLELIARLAIKYDVWVLSDEVYEHLTFDGAKHVPIATLPGMWERTLTLSSAGKTFSFTGWKIGWATGPAPLVKAAQAAHQFLTYAVATPLQHAMAAALAEAIDGDYLQKFRQDYAERRRVLGQALDAAGFISAPAEGTYFTLADFSPLSKATDRTFAEELVRVNKVCTIPPSVFYAQNKEAGRKLLRFAFCKALPTLEEAGRRLRARAPATS